MREAARSGSTQWIAKRIARHPPGSPLDATSQGSIPPGLRVAWEIGGRTRRGLEGRARRVIRWLLSGVQGQGPSDLVEVAAPRSFGNRDRIRQESRREG